MKILSQCAKVKAKGSDYLSVPSCKKHRDGTVPSRKKHLDGTVPSRKKHIDGTVESHKNHH